MLFSVYGDVFKVVNHHTVCLTAVQIKEEVDKLLKLSISKQYSLFY